MFVNFYMLRYRLLFVILTALVFIHLIGNLWHGDAHITLDIYLSGIKTAFVFIVILISPIVGVVLIWIKHSLLGSWTVGLSMVGSVIFSVYHHFILISPANIEHLPLGSADDHAQFANSAGFIALVALSTALLAFYLVGKLQSKNSGVA